jgi:glutaredoxin-like YruB-family protein
MTAKQPIVKVYSTKTCPWCVKAKEFLKKHNIKFEDIDVTNNMALKQEVFLKSGQNGVPVIEVGKKVITGFDEDELSEALGL